MKALEVKTADVRQVLMPVTHTTGETCSSNISTHNAVPTVQVNGKKKTQSFNPGRLMTTHRKDDEELFKHLRNNPEGIGVKGKMANTKVEQFQIRLLHI